MGAIKPPQQMGMLMSAGSASSLLTRGVMGKEGLQTKRSLGLWRDSAVITRVGKHRLIRAGEVLSRHL